MPASLIGDQTVSKENRNFIALLSIAVVMLVGIIAQNVVMTLKPKTAELQIDVDKVRQEIEAAGLTLKEAMHWKEL